MAQVRITQRRPPLHIIRDHVINEEVMQSD
jgi:hypothetical protein